MKNSSVLEKICPPDGMREKKRIHLPMIVAVGRKGVIGNEGKIPWKVPADLAHFKNETTGYDYVVGRKTHESIVEATGKTLPGRKPIIITKNKTYHYPGCMVISENHVEQVLKIAQFKKVIVIGGAEIYKMFMPYATELIVSYIDFESAGDAFFPQIGDEWDIVSSEDKWCVKSNRKFKIVRFKRR